MSDRQLATIQTITNLEPIPDADRIEKATILGWECVVKKGTFKVGDKCIYIEIDSLLPKEVKYWEFMTERKFRVKTIKLKKQISQGLVVPITDFSAIDTELKVGTDVTEKLGITKWESESDKEANSSNTPRKKHGWFIKFMTRFSWYRKLTKTRSKSFPEWISKTDEPRCQSLIWSKILENAKTKKLYVTEKLDGQSATYWYNKTGFRHEFGICSRAVRKFKIDGSNWSKTAIIFNIEHILKDYYHKTKQYLAIQGEIIGPPIQSNKYAKKDFDFYIFNVFDIKTKKYFSLEEIIKFGIATGLKTVPVLDEDYILPETVAELIEFSKGNSILLPVKREGIVIRSHDQTLSFKAINPEFLLEHGL